MKCQKCGRVLFETRWDAASRVFLCNRCWPTMPIGDRVRNRGKLPGGAMPSFRTKGTGAKLCSWPKKGHYNRISALGSARPVTSDREYTADEWEFLKACDEERVRIRPRHLATSDYLRILIGLGYAKHAPRENP